jgi:hypothetical protein
MKLAKMIGIGGVALFAGTAMAQDGGAAATEVVDSGLKGMGYGIGMRSEEHTSELQSR